MERPWFSSIVSERVSITGVSVALLAVLIGALAVPGAGVARGTGAGCGVHLSATTSTTSPSTAARLGWTSGAVLPSAYTVERSDDDIVWAPIATVPPPKTACAETVTYIDSGLAPDTTYFYRVGGSKASMSTAPPPLVVRPVGDPSQAVSVEADEVCTDGGSCEMWADVDKAPFGGSFRTVGNRVSCGTACDRYAVRAEFTYGDGHSTPIEIVAPEGYSIDDSFAYPGDYRCPPTVSCNVGNAAWLTGQSILGNNGRPVLVLCSDYPVNPSPSAVAQNVGAFAELALVNPLVPHRAWIYFVRTGGFTPACGVGGSSTADKATYKWGQLWSATVTAKLRHHGLVVQRARLGSLTIGHHRWAFRHRRGRYTVQVCGVRARKGATNAHACIERRYTF